MLARALYSVLALFAAQALFACGVFSLPPYESDAAKGPTNLQAQTRFSFFIGNGLCSGEVHSTQLQGCSQPLKLEVRVYDYVPYADIRIDDSLQAVYVTRKPDQSRYCSNVAQVEVYANCGHGYTARSAGAPQLLRN